MDSSPETTCAPALVQGGEYASIAEWISANPEWVDLLYINGSILFRGFDVLDPAAFDTTLDSLLEPVAEFSEETSPRSSIGARAFTSTDYPRRYPIQFHHEFSYRKNYPDRVAFCCLTPAASGGATPLADSRKVLRRLRTGVVERFEKLGIAYVRNFSGLGVSWEKSFGTTDKARISEYCRAHDIEHSWTGDDLRTRQTAPAVITHPVTAERAWFNSVLNLNVAGTEPESVREAMRSLPAGSLPTNTTYGSGDPIEPDVLEQVRQAYAQEAIRFRWHKGDVLLIDNVLTAHARDPFEGNRSIIVGMGSAITRPG
ncbi:MAG TPA: TauD/TfdA family dioxygenase [Streptosporangiaceae bacterium]|jgi:alpha-ketoglutarate-dependent taurine dioxygenase